MDISEGIQIIGPALLIKEHSTLVISDVHIGYEEALNKQGILMPRSHSEQIMERMNAILVKTEKIKTIIINGDLKHEFGTISEQEWRETLKFLDLLLANSSEVILIKGNHDTILGPIAQKRSVKVVDSWSKDDVLVLHGDKLPGKNTANTIIIGHEHPAISIGDGVRRELFKCFLKGKYKGSTLIAIPSFNPLIEGTDILKEALLSPFLKNTLDFEAYVLPGQLQEALYFGKVRDIAKLGDK